uniref:Uncharacterized protein n=1 Tax=Panagrolaimus superbus TaxID=310955 RepID=A0A914XWJ3_9BILA
MNNNQGSRIERILLQNKEVFLQNLKTCSINEINIKIDLKFNSLSFLTHSSGGLTQDLCPLAVYPKCMKKIKECFNGFKCLISSQYNVFDKIINFCSDETFTKFNLTFKPAKRPIKTYIDQMNELAKEKIGPIFDSHTTNIPEKYIYTFGNLTFEEFEAVKMISTTIPFLKQYLCDSGLVKEEDVRIVRNFDFVENYLILPESPKLPQKVINIFQTFTAEKYKALKLILMVESILRWSFCSPIFAISPSKELTNIYSQSITLWTLQNCRAMADQNIMTRSAICHGPGLLFGGIN